MSEINVSKLDSVTGTDLTLNADGAGKGIKFQCNGTEVVTIDSTGFVGDGSQLTNLPSGTDTKWTGTATDLVAGTGRTSLGLGDSATKDVGTTTGTIAEGDHGHSGMATLTADQSWSGSQRGTPSVVTDGTLDLTSANNFKYTPGAADNLEFSGETSSAGQSGFITIINTTPYVISLVGNVKKGTSWDVSTTAGTYLVSYYCDGTNVYVSASEALA